MCTITDNSWALLVPIRPMALSPGGGVVPNSSVPPFPAKAKSSPTATTRYWNLWWRLPPRRREQGPRPGSVKGRDTQTANHVSHSICRLNTKPPITETDILPTLISQLYVLMKRCWSIFSNHTQRAMFITCSWNQKTHKHTPEHTTSNSKTRNNINSI